MDLLVIFYNFLKHVLKLSEEKQHEHLLDEIKEVSRLLACNRQWFELESNQDMIEACIYEDRALQARYRHLLDVAKQQGIAVPPFETYF